MKREILFRGIAIHDNQFVYGNYIHSKRMSGYSCEHRIVNQETGLETDIMPETLGQFTGLLDKNGKQIFEGDIVKHNVYSNEYSELAIGFKNGRFCFDIEPYQFGDNFRNILPSYGLEIVGTIHDHLLKGEQCQTN